MPFKSLLITACIENVLNKFIYKSHGLKSACKQLNGKFLRIFLKKAYTVIPLVLIFSEYQVDVLGDWDGEADCSVTIHMRLLSKIFDRQQFTSMIRQGELKIKGDLHVMQNFISFVELVEFDISELISRYIGDILAEGTIKMMRSIMSSLIKDINNQHSYIADLLTEEWNIAPGQYEVEWFIKKISVISRAVELFEKRLEKLEL